MIVLYTLSSGQSLHGSMVFSSALVLAHSSPQGSLVGKLKGSMRIGNDTLAEATTEASINFHPFSLWELPIA